MKINKADYKGRVTLGSKYANRSFELHETPLGLMLKPLRVIDERSVTEILERNPELAAYLTDGGLQVRE